MTEFDKPEQPKQKSKFNRKEALFIFLAIGAASLLIRLLINYNFHTSGLLYIGVPYLVALAIFWFSDPRKIESVWWASYWNYFRLGLIIMLGSSIVLFEGFICVLMFMPIYFGIMLIAFIIHLLSEKFSKKNGKNYVHIFPLIILLFSLEGTHESLSFEREHQVTLTYLTTQTPQAIRENLTKPLNFDKEKPWFMQLFPQPYNVEAGTLIAGDVHKVDYRYHRWFFTNTHEGSIRLLIEEVEDMHIKTKVYTL